MNGEIRLPSDHELLRRAILRHRPAQPNGKQLRGQYRWAVVMRIFGLGSTYAQALCRRLGLDPDVRVRSAAG